MNSDPGYDAALTAALTILHLAERHPEMSRQEKLAKATFIVLGVVDGVERRLAKGAVLPVPASAERPIGMRPVMRMLPAGLKQLMGRKGDER